MNNERAEYMKFVGRIAVNALITMSILWDEMQYEAQDEIYELCEDYPIDKSFDEFAFDFAEWFYNWHDKI